VMGSSGSYDPNFALQVFFEKILVFARAA
jgi:hypothetical protein